MLKFNIEVDQALLGPDPLARRDYPTLARRNYGYRHLGRGSGRVLEHDRRLAKILIDYFFVEGMWLPIYRPLEGKRGTRVRRSAGSRPTCSWPSTCTRS